MHPINAFVVARVATRCNMILQSEIAFGTAWWFIYAAICCVLVIFAGIMSGLTLGLMSISLVDMEILKQSGTPTEKKQAATILPVLQKQHQLLVTLLLCNAAAMEALPIYLDKLFNQYVAIILSVTFVLAFGEVIPQSICTRYGLAVGANFICLVRVLMVICCPIAYPIGKVLDFLLGHNEALFRRAQLKALVSIHSQEAGKGGELTHDETTIISGALDLTEKTAQEAMTPIESTFSLDVNSKLDWEAMGKILARGHSRVPVYSGNPKNIIGLLLVKTLLTVRPETETPVSAVSIRKIPRVPADMPLYDILNEFQKGHSHMAAVVKAKPKNTNPPTIIDVEKSENEHTETSSDLATPLLSKLDENTYSTVDIDKISKQNNLNNYTSNQQDYTLPGSILYSDDIEEGEVIGIITLEDVFEELLQEEIVDETDEFVDVHKRIRVAAVAAASSVARAPSARRLKSVGSRHGQGMKKVGEDESCSKIVDVKSELRVTSICDPSYIIPLRMGTETQHLKSWGPSSMRSDKLRIKVNSHGDQVLDGDRDTNTSLSRPSSHHVLSSATSTTVYLPSTSPVTVAPQIHPTTVPEKHPTPPTPSSPRPPTKDLSRSPLPPPLTIDPNGSHLKRLSPPKATPPTNCLRHMEISQQGW
ncbi:uncharacterized protein [Phyllobates terribilis]|uniref:uncharacterized protein n=1 Tax=Phyllobates terribilis TaxID=111132 RepID=UPI003CCACAA5